MTPKLGHVLGVAFTAGALGLAASVALDGPGPLLNSELGQRALQSAMAASAPAVPDGIAVAERGKPLPALVVHDLDGATVPLPGAYAGRPLLINLWASWCGPCIKEMPELQRFSAQQGEHGVQVLGIALDDTEAVRDFLRQVPVNYPILRDAAGPADAGVRLGNPKGVLPYSVLVAADGRLLKQRIGPFADGEIARWVGE